MVRMAGSFLIERDPVEIIYSDTVCSKRRNPTGYGAAQSICVGEEGAEQPSA
jgi:hypothetical protein